MIVELKNLSKAYAVPVLRDVSLRLKAGESLALVGANGAGKSTLIKILLGLVKPDSGQAKLFGEELGSVKALARVGYLPELPSFWGDLSAYSFLKVLARLKGIPDHVSEVRIDSLLGSLGLSLRGRRPMAGYSKGMLQRAGVAQALLHDPDLLILDEPMSGLDPRAQEKLRRILVDLKRAGKTLLVSSHSLEDIRTLCDRVVVLERSRVVLDGSTESVLEELVRRYQSSEPWDEDPMTDLPLETKPAEGQR